MRKSFGLFMLVLLCVSTALAQESASAPQDQSAATQETPKKKVTRETPKYEISAGFAYRSYYQTSGSTIWLKGWYGSADYNLKRWLGAEAELMGVYDNQGAVLGKTSIYNFLVGPKIYPAGHRKLTPFGHALLGIARYSNTTPPYGGYPSATRTASAYAWEAGGGLDWYFSRHWGVRVFQADVGNVNFFGGPTGSTRMSRRIASGIVYRFGKK